VKKAAKPSVKRKTTKISAKKSASAGLKAKSAAKERSSVRKGISYRRR